MGQIYTVLNRIDGKQYIGSTMNFRERKRHHIKTLNGGGALRKRNTKLAIAGRIFGRENFEIKVLEDNLLQEQLIERETYYILKYNTWLPTNNLLKSKFKPKGRSIVGLNDKGDILYHFSSPYKVSSELGVVVSTNAHSNTIESKRYYSINNIFWIFEDLFNIELFKEKIKAYKEKYIIMNKSTNEIFSASTLIQLDKKVCVKEGSFSELKAGFRCKGKGRVFKVTHIKGWVFKDME